MHLTVDQVYEEALRLPDESKSVLAERLVEYLATHPGKDLERMHLDEVERRRDEILTGQVKGIDGDDALAHARRLVNA